MKSTMNHCLCAAAVLVTLTCSGCDDTRDDAADTTKSQAPPAVSNAPRPATPTTEPPNTPTHTASSTPHLADDQTLTLTGLTFTVPKDWAVEPITPGPFAAKAAFNIPGAGSEGPCAVRITHYPGMKGKDDMNIDRWASQFRGPDGKPLTRDTGVITKRDVADGKIRVTMVQFTGSMASGMSGSGPIQPDQRLVAAIVDHARGPHFVKVSGSVESMKKANDSIVGFLHSADIK